MLLITSALVASCDLGARLPPTGAPGLAGSPSAPPLAEPASFPPIAPPVETAAAPPAATPAPTPTSRPAEPVRDAFAPGALAVTVSDQLRVRSKPEVSDASHKYTPLLRAGTQLVITGGPVNASGYTWYRVLPLEVTLQGGVDEGWVAIADHDGTPWVALSDDPTPGYRLASAEVTRPKAAKADARAAAASINAFGLELYRSMLRDPDLELKGKGVVMSPTSVAIALAMARAGAKGTTASEIDAALHSKGWAELATGLNSLEQLLASRDAAWTDDEGASHALSLRIANAAFAQDGWPIEDGFLARIGQAMGAGLALVDFIGDPDGALKAINGWVARQTANRIPRLLLPDNVTPDTRLVLVNAIYVKANWQLEFDQDRTEARAFTRTDGSRVSVPTMALWGGQTVPYAAGDGWKATELRYWGADHTTPLAMTIVMPDNLTAFERGLTPATLRAIDTKLDRGRERLNRVSYSDAPEDCGTYPYQVELYMPRFGIDTRAGLVPSLRAMGIKAAVTRGAADFSGITPDGQLFIGEVIHQANIDVDEKGTEAAAATAIVFDVGGCTGPSPAKTIRLRLNRPFLYLIRDTQTGAILFMGRVMDPSARS